MMKVIDAEGHVLGRLASLVAQELLAGEEIRIVNADRCIITGKKKFLFSGKMLNCIITELFENLDHFSPTYRRRPAGLNPLMDLIDQCGKPPVLGIDIFNSRIILI